MIEFIDFIEVNTDKQIGIATIKYKGSVILRYKIMRNKDGNGWFPTEAAYRVVDASGETYMPAFMLDSRSEHAEVERILRTNINAYFAKRVQPQQTTMYNPSYTAKPLSDNVPF